MSEEDVLKEVKCDLVGRREFLKRVSSAGVGAVIVPSLPAGPADAATGQAAGDAMESAFKEPRRIQPKCVCGGTG
jgi:hypothetical protein